MRHAIFLYALLSCVNITIRFTHPLVSSQISDCHLHLHNAPLLELMSGSHTVSLLITASMLILFWTLLCLCRSCLSSTSCLHRHAAGYYTRKYSFKSVCLRPHIRLSTCSASFFFRSSSFCLLQKRQQDLPDRIYEHPCAVHPPN